MTTLWQRLFPNQATKILLALYLITLIWWVMMASRGIVETTENYLFGIPFTIIPLFGGISALHASIKWKNISKMMQMSLVFLSVSMISWAVGSAVYMYYNLALKVAVPDPSIADIFYYLSQPLWLVGLLLLIYFLELKLALKYLVSRLVFFFSPFILVCLGYYFLLSSSSGLTITLRTRFFNIFIDMAALLPDVLILGIIFFIVHAVLFGKINQHYKIPIVLLSGFVISFIADFSYIYTTNQQTFYVGNWVDLLFLTAMFLLALGVNSFSGATRHQAS